MHINEERYAYVFEVEVNYTYGLKMKLDKSTVKIIST